VDNEVRPKPLNPECGLAPRRKARQEKTEQYFENGLKIFFAFFATLRENCFRFWL
jgi:hypothetical protein